MGTKTLKIYIPEGYEIDKEKSTFKNIVFKEIESGFSKNWSEFCAKHDTFDKESFINTKGEPEVICGTARRHEDTDKDVFPSKFGEAIVALMQLLTIREKEYTKGWEPTYRSNTIIPTILNDENSIIVGSIMKTHKILTFPTFELRDEFYKNWKDLLEVAKPLL